MVKPLETVGVEDALTTRFWPTKRMLNKVLAAGGSRNIYLAFSRWFIALDTTDPYTHRLYRGSPHVASLYLEALYPFTLLRDIQNRSAYAGVPFWMLMRKGLEHPDKLIRIFHCNCVMLNLYPYSVFAAVTATSDNSDKHKKASHGTRSLDSTLARSLSFLRKDIQSLIRLLVWLQDFTKQYGNFANYIEMLQRHPEILQKAKLLNLPLYTSFIKTGE